MQRMPIDEAVSATMKPSQFEKRMTIKVIIMCCRVIVPRMSCIAAAEPERAREMAKTVTKLRDMTMMLIAPINARKLRLFCGTISEPMTAAWPEPMPGRKEQRGAAIDAAENVLISSFRERYIFLMGTIVCFFIFSLFFDATSNEEIPNRPVRRGIRGSFTGRLKVSRPRRPAKLKIRKEMTGRSSRRMRQHEINMRMNGRAVCIKGQRAG